LPSEVKQTSDALGDDPAQTRRLATVEQLSNDKIAELQQTIALRRRGQVAEALAIVNSGRGRNVMDNIRRVTAEMIAAKRSTLELLDREAARQAGLQVLVASGGSALLLVLIVMAAAMSSRDFREQSVQSWLRTGQSELSSDLQGDQSLAKLGDATASFLARFLDAQGAAVYFSGNDGIVGRIGSWGTARPGASPASDMVTGLTEQAFREKQLLHVRDVPEGYFNVTSALGRHTPREIVVLPISASGAVNGVIELGFFRTLLPHEVELLRRVAETAGTALRSAQYRSNVQELLEATQRQAEELQTQQEELRVSNEELEQQTRMLQQSQERLSNQQAELEETNAQLEEQTRPSSGKRQDLLRAQGELQRASTYKSEFLANMSHELRTPLNSSLILAKLLSDNRDGNLTEEQISFAQTIYSAGNDLLTLINDILDLSKIEAGKLEVRPEQIGIARLTDDLSKTFQPVARDKALEFAVTVEPGLPASLFTDSTRVQQILRNLLSNAFKFTERGGVYLSVRGVGRSSAST
jgi:signal transduction histidine kinase